MTQPVITNREHTYRTQKAIDAPLGYEPNWNDSRVRATATKAVNFVQSNMKPGKPRALGVKLYLVPYFGQTQTNTCKYLMSVLLESYDSYYSKDKNRAMQYVMRPEGVKFILNKLGIKEMTEEEMKQFVIEKAQETYKDELEDLKYGTVTYTQKSHRRWNRLQNVMKNTKHSLLADSGFYHMYDVECCAPTLLYQYAQEIGLDEYQENISEYIKHRTQIRNMLAYDTGVPLEKIKIVINALFSGGKLGANRFFSITDILDGNMRHVVALRDHPFIIQLKKEISTMWKTINTTINRTYKPNKNGVMVMSRVTSRQKWDIYFMLESKVLDSVVEYCEVNKHRAFLEHDGWSTCDYIDPNLLVDHIKHRTGFRVKLDYESIEHMQSKELFKLTSTNK